MTAISHFILRKIEQSIFLCRGSPDCKKPSLNTLEKENLSADIGSLRFSSIHASTSNIKSFKAINSSKTVELGKQKRDHYVAFDL